MRSSEVWRGMVRGYKGRGGEDVSRMMRVRGGEVDGWGG